MYAPLKGGSFARGGTFDTSYVQTDTAMFFNPKYYWVSATLFGTDGVLNRGPNAAMSYVESKMVNAAGRMAQLIGTDAFLDGQGTNSQVTAIDGQWKLSLNLTICRKSRECWGTLVECNNPQTMRQIGRKD